VQLDPLNARTRIVLGRDYVVAGDYQRALDEALRGAQLDPLHPLQLGLGPSLPSSPADDVKGQTPQVSANGCPGWSRKRAVASRRAPHRR
jgi:hypothetical protein